MLSPKEVMLVNMIFSCSLGLVAVALFIDALIPSRSGRPREVNLVVRKDGILFRKMRLLKGHYRIGRDPGCDVSLEGMGIPVLAGELVIADRLSFRNFSAFRAALNDLDAGPEFEVRPGDEIRLFDYSFRLETP